MSAGSSRLVDVKVDTEDFSGEYGTGYLGLHRLIISDLPHSWVCSLSLAAGQTPMPRLYSCDPLSNASSRNDSAVIVRLSPLIPAMMNDTRTSQ